MAARRTVHREADRMKDEAERRPDAAGDGEPGVIDRLRARLAGTVHVADGVDLTEPTGEVWDAER